MACTSLIQPFEGKKLEHKYVKQQHLFSQWRLSLLMFKSFDLINNIFQKKFILKLKHKIQQSFNKLNRELPPNTSIF